MPRVRLVHWKPEEASEGISLLRAAGYTVDCGPMGPGLLRDLKASPPDAFVIDLGRLPSHGREVAAALRQQKATRFVPLVFVGGEPPKVEGIRKLLPDATYTEWKRIRGDLRKAIARKPATVATPPVIGYSGTPLPKKLGIRDNSIVVLVNAPDGFREGLGDLPGGVTFSRRMTARTDLIVWFVRSLADLRKGIARMSEMPERAGLWIAWPKKTSRLAADLGERDVRGAGLAAGLVDYKICAIDETWSGLKFSHRR